LNASGVPACSQRVCRYEACAPVIGSSPESHSSGSFLALVVGSDFGLLIVRLRRPGSHRLVAPGPPTEVLSRDLLLDRAAQSDGVNSLGALRCRSISDSRYKICWRISSGRRRSEFGLRRPLSTRRRPDVRTCIQAQAIFATSETNPRFISCIHGRGIQSGTVARVALRRNAHVVRFSQQDQHTHPTDDESHTPAPTLGDCRTAGRDDEFWHEAKHEFKNATH
jgi:hypothetical protein